MSHPRADPQDTCFSPSALEGKNALPPAAHRPRQGKKAVLGGYPLQGATTKQSLLSAAAAAMAVAPPPPPADAPLPLLVPPPRRILASGLFPHSCLNCENMPGKMTISANLDACFLTRCLGVLATGESVFACQLAGLWGFSNSSNSPWS